MAFIDGPYLGDRGGDGHHCGCYRFIVFVEYDGDV
jgi:hypothetical protein